MTTPTQPAENTPANTQPQPKHRTWKRALTVTTLTLLTAGAATAAWFWLIPHTPPNITPPDTPNPQAQAAIDTLPNNFTIQGTTVLGDDTATFTVTVTNFQQQPCTEKGTWTETTAEGITDSGTWGPDSENRSALGAATFTLLLANFAGLPEAATLNDYTTRLCSDLYYAPRVATTINTNTDTDTDADTDTNTDTDTTFTTRWNIDAANQFERKGAWIAAQKENGGSRNWFTRQDFERFTVDRNLIDGFQATLTWTINDGTLTQITATAGKDITTVLNFSTPPK